MPTSDVNVFVGSQETGNTFPGATLPHGMVQMSPVLEPRTDARFGLWAYSSGYHRLPDAKSARVHGIGHTALSGTGLNDGGDFIVRPCARSCGRPSRLLHASEKGSPGYYAARFIEEEEEVQKEVDVTQKSVQHRSASASSSSAATPYVDVEVAAMLRGGLLRARFAGVAATRPVMRIELRSPLDALVHGTVERGSAPGVLMGRRSSSKTHHCAAEHTVYWHATFEPPFTSFRAIPPEADGSDSSGSSRSADEEHSYSQPDGRAAANSTFSPPSPSSPPPSAFDVSWEPVFGSPARGSGAQGNNSATRTIVVRLFVSHVDAAGAARNAEAELTGQAETAGAGSGRGINLV